MLNIKIDNFSYNKSDLILKDINFSVNASEIVGLIGENGAGKSTTIKTILGLTESENKVKIEENKTLSYIPERPIIYEEMTLWEHIELCAASYGLHSWEPEARQLLRKFHLDANSHRYPKDFSKGMQQKVMLILAYLPRPDIYIIDEPIMGLDLLSTKTVLEVLQEEKKRGAGILMCTHALDTAEKYCDRLIVLANKTIKYRGTLQHLKTITHHENGDLLDCFATLIENEEAKKYG